MELENGQKKPCLPRSKTRKFLALILGLCATSVFATYFGEKVLDFRFEKGNTMGSQNHRGTILLRNSSSQERLYQLIDQMVGIRTPAGESATVDVTVDVTIHTSTVDQLGEHLMLARKLSTFPNLQWRWNVDFDADVNPSFLEQSLPQTNEVNEDDFRCDRKCSRVTGIIFWEGHAGLNDRNYLFHRLHFLNRVLCSKIHPFLACEILSKSHNNNTSLKCDHTMAYYAKYVDQFGSKIFGDGSEKPSVFFHQSYHDDQDEIMKFISTLEHTQWHWKLNNPYGSLSKLENPGTLFSRLKDKEMCNNFHFAESDFAHFILTQVFARFGVKWGEHRNEAVYVHIRRGDAIKECNTSLVRVKEFLRCSFATASERTRKLPILFSSDETSGEYRDSVKAELRNYNKMTYDLDKILADELSEEVKRGRIPSGVQNNYFVYSMIAKVNWSLDHYLELRRSRCDDCKVMDDDISP